MRYQIYLRQRYHMLLGYLGGMMIFIGLMILAPLLALPFFPEEAEHAAAFVFPALPLLIIGRLLQRNIRKHQLEGSPTLQEGMVVILLGWVIAMMTSSLPLVLAADLTFTQGVFEATSGLTTTGLSVVDVLQAPNLILLYRSILQFVGGAGFAIIVLSAIAGAGGAGLTSAEGRNEQLAPHVRQSASIVLRLYLGFAAVGILALILAGMTPFDSLIHTFSAVATGGFSSRPESIAYWDSFIIELILMILMCLGSINFLTSYAVLVQRKGQAFVKSGEIRVMTAAFLVAIPILILGVTTQLYPDWGKALRVGAFEAVSALTGTGYNISTTATWNGLGWMVLILLMTTGGGTGSTAGGIKQFRIYVLIIALLWEVRRAFLPSHAVNRPTIFRGIQREYLSDIQVRLIALFTFLYITILFIGSTILMTYGYPLADSFFEFASALGTVGMSVGITSRDAPDGVLWTMTTGMLLGRLEFFAVVIGLVKLVKDLRDILQGKPKQDAQSANP